MRTLQNYYVFLYLNYVEQWFPTIADQDYPKDQRGVGQVRLRQCLPVRLQLETRKNRVGQGLGV